MSAVKANYFDGIQPVRRQAQAAIAEDGLKLSVDGGPPFIWAFDSIRLADPAGHPLVFHRERSGAATGESLEVADAEWAAGLINACPSLQGDRAEKQRFLRKIVVWSVAAILSLVLTLRYGMPLLADTLTPVVPWSMEERLGQAVEQQALWQMSGGKPKFCQPDDASPGARALKTMVDKLTAHAELPGPVSVRVLQSSMQNAFALPGGRVVLLSGFIEKAESADEVAGVLAHELGHVANRDSLRSIIHGSGVSIIAGLLIGDFTGGGAILLASQTLLSSRYSRENERDADRFGVNLMLKAGADPRALSRFLRRVAAFPGERSLELLNSHPVTEDRVAAIDAATPATTFQPILSADAWRALKAICKAGG